MAVEYFSAAATALPVLLVATLLDKRYLRDYSRSRCRRRYAMTSVVLAAVGILASVLGTVPGMHENAYLSVTLRVTVSVAVGLMVGFVVDFAKFTLYDEPHPDRVEADLRRAKEHVRRLEAKAQKRADD